MVHVAEHALVRGGHPQRAVLPRRQAGHAGDALVGEGLEALAVIANQTAVAADPYEALPGLGHRLRRGGEQPVLRGEYLLYIPVDIQVLLIRRRAGGQHQRRDQQQYAEDSLHCDSALPRRFWA